MRRLWLLLLALLLPLSAAAQTATSTIPMAGREIAASATYGNVSSGVAIGSWFNRHNGASISCNVTTAATSSVTVVYQFLDPVDATYRGPTAGLSMTTTGNWTMVVAPLVTSAAADIDTILARSLPHGAMRLFITKGDTSDWTFSCAVRPLGGLAAGAELYPQ